MKLKLDTEKKNYVIMKGGVAVSGVFTIYANAEQEYFRRVNFLRSGNVPQEEPLELVALTVVAETKHPQGGNI